MEREGGSIPIDPSWFVQQPGVEGIDLSPGGDRLAITVAGPGDGDLVTIKELPDGPESRLAVGV